MQFDDCTSPLSGRCNDEARTFVALYLMFLPGDAGQRPLDLREVFHDHFCCRNARSPSCVAGSPTW